MSFFAFLGKIGILVLVVTMGLGLYEAFDSLPNKAELITDLGNNTASVAKGWGLFSWGLMLTTGAWQNDWLPSWIHPKGELLFIIEDMPHLDSTAFIIPILFALLVFGVAKMAGWYPDRFWGMFWFWIIILLLMLLMVVVQYVIAYHALQNGGEMLGIGAEKALEIRQDKVEMIAAHPSVVWLGIVLFFVNIGVWLKILGGNSDNG